MGIQRALPAVESSFPPPYNFTGTGREDVPQEWIPVASQARGSESRDCSPGIRTELSLRPARTRASTRNVQTCRWIPAAVHTRSPPVLVHRTAHRPARPPGHYTVILQRAVPRLGMDLPTPSSSYGDGDGSPIVKEK